MENRCRQNWRSNSLLSSTTKDAERPGALVETCHLYEFGRYRMKRIRVTHLAPALVLTVLLARRRFIRAGTFRKQIPTRSTVPGTNGVSNPKVISSPNPEYTDRARRKKIRGIVLLSIVVTPEGTRSRCESHIQPRQGSRPTGIESGKSVDVSSRDQRRQACSGSNLSCKCPSTFASSAMPPARNGACVCLTSANLFSS